MQIQWAGNLFTFHTAPRGSGVGVGGRQGSGACLDSLIYFGGGEF